MQETRKSAENDAVPLIERIVDECPRRLAGSDSERTAQQILREEFEQAGLETDFHRFRYNRSVYATFVLHFGLAALASALYFGSPWVALVLHSLVAVSYLGDSTKTFFLLRRLFPFHQSQNLIGRAPADGEPSKRIVLVAHADAAFTGKIFSPEAIRRTSNSPRIPLDLLRKPLRLATLAVATLVGIDAAAIAAGNSLGLTIGLVALSIPPLATALFNLEVVLRDEVVPGANDNLTGCAAIPLLAERLLPQKPDDVELVFVATGSEEAGTGGSIALARDMKRSGEWDPDDTTIVGIDGLTNGELRYAVEAEVIRMPIADFLVEAIEETRGQREEWSQVEGHEMQAGATDALPFYVQGYPAVTLLCIDPQLGSPRHYHHPEDRPENLDPEQFDLSIDYAEALVERLMER